MLSGQGNDRLPGTTEQATLVLAGVPFVLLESVLAPLGAAASCGGRLEVDIWPVLARLAGLAGESGESRERADCGRRRRITGEAAGFCC